jgi:dipeptidyl-peptidase-4
VVKTLLNAEDPLKNHFIGNIELGKITGHDGTALNYRLIKPTAFDPSKKYPVLVYVYNGPHVQLVNNGYLAGGSLWMNYFAERGYLVFTIDGRGSANRGKKFEQAIHRQLGNAEMEDQLAGVEWLRKQPFVDEGKMAIHGWSFGGFMTTSLMLRQPGVFKCGIAGGPVLDWSLYEVMYTERYMDTPQENPEGYKENNLSNYVKNLSGPLLMIHGTDDDVVVMQHNMRFLKTCITNNIPIDFFAYPGHAHNVRGKDRVHLMHKILDYVEHELHH